MIMEDGLLWYNYNMGDMRDITKCIKQLEKVVRDSLEYDEWQRTAKWNDVNSITCPICDENYEENNSKCETHHHPVTLFNIVDEILENHIKENVLDEKTGFKIAEEVMQKHFNNEVKYINLCVHCHKKYHNGHLKVNEKINSIFNALAEEGKKKLLEEKEKIEKVEELRKQNKIK